MLPEIGDFLQDVNNNTALVHESVVGTLDHIDKTLVRSHSVLHPSHGILGDTLILVAVPDPDGVRVCGVREPPRLSIMVEDLEQISVGALGRLGVRRG